MNAWGKPGGRCSVTQCDGRYGLRHGGWLVEKCSSTGIKGGSFRPGKPEFKKSVPIYRTWACLYIGCVARVAFDNHVRLEAGAPAATLKHFLCVFNASFLGLKCTTKNGECRATVSCKCRIFMESFGRCCEHSRTFPNSCRPSPTCWTSSNKYSHNQSWSAQPRPFLWRFRAECSQHESDAGTSFVQAVSSRFEKVSVICLHNFSFLSF